MKTTKQLLIIVAATLIGLPLLALFTILAAIADLWPDKSHLGSGPH